MAIQLEIHHCKQLDGRDYLFRSIDSQPVLCSGVSWLLVEKKAWNNWNMYACLVGCWGKCSKNAMHSSQVALFGHKLQYVAWDSDTISPTFKKGLSEADLPLWKVAILQWIRKFERHSESLGYRNRKICRVGTGPKFMMNDIYIYTYICTMFVNLNIHRYQVSMIFLHLNQCLTSQELHKICKIQF